MQLFWLAIAWIAYATLHSVLASFGAKNWVFRHWPRVVPAYRLAYNVIALLTVLPLVWFAYAIESAWLWRWTGLAAWLANGLALAALLGVAASSRAYDMNDFLGLKQAQSHPANEAFVISPFHRYVRHPWYCFSLILLWTRDMNAPLLVSAVAVTLYFIIGSRLEERKLVATYGDRYRRYMTNVPGLLPLPWKYLTAAEARLITD